MKNNAIVWALPLVTAAAALAVGLAHANVEMFLVFNSLGSITGDTLWQFATVFGDGAVVLALALLLVRRRPDLVWALVIAALLSTAYTRPLKAALDVKRPPAVLGAQVHVIGPMHRERSFPSGHAVTAFAGAAVLALGLRRRRIAALGIAAATLVGISRMAVGVHWPIDVLAGAAGGWLSGAFGVLLAHRWRWGLRPLPQALAALAFAAFAIELIAGYNNGYAAAMGFMRFIGALALAGFALSFLFEKQEQEMQVLDLSGRKYTASPPDGQAPDPAAPEVSVVIPVYNEEGNVEELVRRTGDAMTGSGRSFEVIIVDDGSRDRTGELLEALAGSRPWLAAVRLIRNYGQSVALQAGFDRARGKWIATLDGDLQNDPYDIPRLVEAMDSGREIDVISGWRKDRKDNLSRRFPSTLANRLISAVTGVRLHDYGCALKVYRAHIVRDIRLYGELHRFIPALAAEVGARVVEVPVNHYARLHGTTKYGLSRTLRVVLDLMWVKFMMRFLRRPMHAFGGVGLALFLGGGAILAWLAFDKLALGHDIGGRPLLLLGALLALIGVQLLATGVIGELLIRVYHEPEGRRLYVLRPPRS